MLVNSGDAGSSPLDGANVNSQTNSTAPPQLYYSKLSKQPAFPLPFNTSEIDDLSHRFELDMRMYAEPDQISQHQTNCMIFC